MLRQDDKVPLYVQLKETIRSSILNGELKYGEKIPTEIELSEIHKISRITVRKAILELVEEGYLIKKQGKGTFVSKPKIERKIVHFLSFSEACKANGLKVTSKVIKKEIIQPTPRDREKLQLDVDDAMIYIQRVRYGGESPVMLENNYFSYKNYNFLLGEDLEKSLYKTLEDKHQIIPSHSGELSLEIVRATEDQTEILKVATGEPLFYMDTVIFDKNERPVHIGKQYIIGEGYKFILK